jgi:uncharacterized repeat protein (TIGR01451 family)
MFRQQGKFRGSVTRNKALRAALLDDPDCKKLPRYSRKRKARVRGAWDPNDKTTNARFECERGQVEVDGEAVSRCVRYFVPTNLAAEPLEYTIEFENKPVATDPALDVVVTDVLDASLDPTTLEIINTTHDSVFSYEIVGQTVTFRFEQIELAPNVIPPEGEGVISYRVSPKADLAIGTEIRNKASIVFDFNPPIETPDVIHVITEPVETRMPGDFDGSGKVDFADFFLFVEHFGQTAEDVSWDPFFDLVPDGRINLDDFFEFVELFSQAERVKLISLGEAHFGRPTDFRLNSNYPNPFNAQTTISYELPSEQQVILSIWNVTGQLVRELVDTHQPIGHYSVTWDGKDGTGQLVGNGLYLYRLKAGRFETVRKMVLVK